jgi:hypothetical protein
MIIISVLIMLFLASLANSILEDGYECYKDTKFWLSLIALLLLGSIAFPQAWG